MEILTLLRYAGVGLFIVFFFGMCILVHELGHLLMALWRGLHVERFSIGFGRRLWGFNHHGVEYIVSMLPFGGYVALPQLDSSGDVETSDGKPLPKAKPLDRILTAFAGPLANIAFGFVLATAVWAIGVEREVPQRSFTVTHVAAESPEYTAGLRAGDVIFRIGGHEFNTTWQTLAERFILGRGSVKLEVRRGTATETIVYEPAPNPEFEGLNYPFFDVRYPTLIGQVTANSPAAAAGLQNGDLVLAVDSQPIANLVDFIRRIRASNGEALSITIERDGRQITLTDIVPQARTIASGETVYVIGAELQPLVEKVRFTPWQQFREVISRTWRTVSALFHGQVQARHMSGPVGIAQVIGVRTLQGINEGLYIVMFVSFSLAIFNLLPIPILDGGHITFALIEQIFGRPLPARIVYYLQSTFAILLISFMVYVTFYDVSRVSRIMRFLRGNDAESSEQVDRPAPAAPAPELAPDNAPAEP